MLLRVSALNILAYDKPSAAKEALILALIISWRVWDKSDHDVRVLYHLISSKFGIDRNKAVQFINDLSYQERQPLSISLMLNA